MHTLELMGGGCHVTVHVGEQVPSSVEFFTYLCLVALSHNHCYFLGKVLEGGKTIVKVKLDDGSIWHRHIDHLFPSQVQTESEPINQEYAPPM